jgi:hypothetical protein
MSRKQFSVILPFTNNPLSRYSFLCRSEEESKDIGVILTSEFSIHSVNAPKNAPLASQIGVN